MKDLPEDFATELGARITTLLNVNPIGRDRFKTSLGVKETVGVGRIIATIVSDVERKYKKTLTK